MRQKTLAEGSFEKYRKPTRREVFLDEMDQVVPWTELCELIAPVYPKGKGPGRPRVGLERMLRIYFLQHWFNLSDPGVEEALYDSRAMRQFVGIDLGKEPAPDETTVCKFRHLMEVHELGARLFEAITEHLQHQGIGVHPEPWTRGMLGFPSPEENRDERYKIHRRTDCCCVAGCGRDLSGRSGAQARSFRAVDPPLA
jgi:transposase-like protein DUF772